MEHYLFAAIVVFVVLVFIASRNLQVFKETVLFRYKEDRFFSYYFWAYFFLGVYWLIKYLV